ncbi:hypothetical protein [Zhongshania sp.]|jgi:hypothetical protein|uniref:hypothetical protein n=1 Tax=Zhongshania sp. TaxID=1971902 RepID=UPI002A81F1FF|nr:hypothetical protein [Zhongshania sp.]
MIRINATRYFFWLLSCWVCITPLSGFANIDDFQERYFAEVDGSTWALHIDSSHTFQHRVTAKLQMGNTRERYLLIGNIDGKRIKGSYQKPIRISQSSEELRFELLRLDDSRVQLNLSNALGKNLGQTILSANRHQNPIDTAILGTWYSVAEPGASASNPYLGEEWAIRFGANGELCESLYLVDTRTQKNHQDPCSQPSSQRWKAVDGKIYTAVGENWQLHFNYRLMGGRLVVSYPSGKRRVANLAN